MKKHLLRISWAISLLLCMSAVSVNAEVFSGEASVIDGDSLIVAGHQVRLFGIDAPELSQDCHTNGAAWRCGEEAKAQLKELTDGAIVQCVSRDEDTYGRKLSVCSSGYLNLNETMVEYGWALAYRKYSSDYVAQELRAKYARSGIWGSTFALPSDYRLAQIQLREKIEEPATPSIRKRVEPKKSYGCVIKGNRNRKGQWIYHLPGMPYYNATKPEEIFCSEAAAQAAGYRRAIVR